MARTFRNDAFIDSTDRREALKRSRERLYASLKLQLRNTLDYLNDDVEYEHLDPIVDECRGITYRNSFAA